MFRSLSGEESGRPTRQALSEGRKKEKGPQGPTHALSWPLLAAGTTPLSWAELLSQTSPRG